MKQDATQSPPIEPEPAVSSAGAPPMFYCGCHGDKGHYLWTEDEDESGKFWAMQPWGVRVDGELQPFPRGGFIVRNGATRFTLEHGWSALSWWDNSIDGRPGSHSTFMVKGTWSAKEVLSMAQRRFPWVFSRFKYEVVLGGGDRSV